MTMELWNKVKQPPSNALKQIRAGRLKGMTDVSPQWRYQVMTEVFGPIGMGWKYEIDKLWTEQGAEGVVFAFALVNLYYKQNDEWSLPIPGIGGSTLVAKENRGLYSSDEGYKMAVTDALSVAMKSLGVAADIYAGKWDGSKYKEQEQPAETLDVPINKDQLSRLMDMLNATEADEEKFLKWAGVKALEVFPASKFNTAMEMLKQKMDKAA